jgi:hypothetical protein
VNRISYKELEDIAKILSEKNVKKVAFQTINPIGGAFKNFDAVAVKPSEFLPYLKKAMKMLDSKNIESKFAAPIFNSLEVYERYVKGKLEKKTEYTNEDCDFEKCIFRGFCNLVEKEFCQNPDYFSSYRYYKKQEINLEDEAH